MTEECVCGFEAKDNRGLSAHQRHCDEYEEADDAAEEPPTVSTGAESPEEATLSEVEQAALERDDGVCRRCGESAQGVHYINASDERLSNIWAMCESCDEDLEGLNRYTKKTEVRRGL